MAASPIETILHLQEVSDSHLREAEASLTEAMEILSKLKGMF